LSEIVPSPGGNVKKELVFLKTVSRGERAACTSEEEEEQEEEEEEEEEEHVNEEEDVDRRESGGGFERCAFARSLSVCM